MYNETDNHEKNIFVCIASSVFAGMKISSNMKKIVS